MPLNTGKTWQNIVGTDDAFDLESRIFHAFCFIASGMVLVNVPLKLFIGLNATAVLAGVLFLLMATSYYLSRYRGKTSFGRNLTFVSVYVVLALNYYYSGGINGSSLLYFIYTYFAIVCIVPKKDLWLWTSAHVMIIGLMLFSELAAPSIVMYRQVSEAERTIDIFTSYICVMALFGTCATFLISAYNKEKNFARQQFAVLNVLDQERSKLMSIIGHDLRAPLSNIHSYLQVASEVHLDDEEREEIHDDLLRSTKTTLEFLDNLLYWSKSRMSGIAHELKVHNLLNLVKPQYHLLNSLAAAKNVTVAIDVGEDVTVLGNDNMIQLIVRNYLNNAIKYTSPGGTVEIGYELKRAHAIIKITDTGTGAYAKLPAGLFETGHWSTPGTEQEKGFGLGLVLCKEFAEAQNGSVGCESRPSGGAIFSLNLPVAVL